MHKALKFFYDRCDEEGNCRIWKCGCTGQGLPVISMNGVRGLYVRRIVAEIVLGRKLSRGEFIFPDCRNVLCIGDFCLKIGSKSDYMRHASKAGAYSSPERNAKRALAAQRRSGYTMDDAREVRRQRFDEGKTLLEIAKIDGRSVDTISRICLNRMWRESARGASVFNQR